MGHLMDDAIGVGLAATQVGVVHRLLVYRISQDARLAALINPELEWSGRETESMEEGCLSLPRVLVDVDRPVHVRVSALITTSSCGMYSEGAASRARITSARFESAMIFPPSFTTTRWGFGAMVMSGSTAVRPFCSVAMMSSFRASVAREADDTPGP